MHSFKVSELLPVLFKIIVLCLRSNLPSCFAALLFTAFALCMFGLYSFMPVVMKVTSATSVNLGILTSDLYSFFLGLFLFSYEVRTFVPSLSCSFSYVSTPQLQIKCDVIRSPRAVVFTCALLQLLSFTVGRGQSGVVVLS